MDRRLGVLAAVLVLVLAGAWLLVGRSGDPAGAAGAGAGGADATGNEAALATVGQPAPDFTATTIDDDEVTLSRFAGRPVWLTFGATWCASCRVEAPDIQEAFEATPGVEVVMVYLSEHDSTVRTYAERLGTTFLHVPDPEGRISAQYHVVGVPVHWFIDGDGVVQSVRFGVLSRDQMDAELAAIGG